MYVLCVSNNDKIPKSEPLSELLEIKTLVLMIQDFEIGTVSMLEYQLYFRPQSNLLILF